MLLLQVEVFSMGQEVDPVAITKAGIERATEGGFDTVIVDTAGRQVVDDTLMTELKNIQVGRWCAQCVASVVVVWLCGMVRCSAVCVLRVLHCIQMRFWVCIKS